MICCGIDPGLGGAIALYDPEINFMEIHDCPVVKVNGKGEMFLPRLIEILTRYKIAMCVIERSQPMPKQGVSSVFSYGRGYGCYLGVIAGLGIAHTKISPNEWKKKLRVPKDKDAARARASELMPAHSKEWMKKSDHGRAEAALLAFYGAHGAQL